MTQDTDERPLGRIVRLPDDEKEGGPLRLPNGELHQFTLKIAGKSYVCACGCNVFHKPDRENLSLFECNACQDRFEAT